MAWRRPSGRGSLPWAIGGRCGSAIICGDGMRRALRILSVTLITAGLVILADAGHHRGLEGAALGGSTRSFQQGAGRRRSSRESKEDFLADPAVVDLGPTGDLERQAEQLADALRQASSRTGEPFGRILIPAIGADYVVRQRHRHRVTCRRDRATTRRPRFPDRARRSAIAGHRTTYGAPFNQIDKIEVGDEIILEMPYATFTYEVSETRIVEPTDVEIVDDVGSERLVLTACHPLYSAAQRYVVFAELSDVTLFPAAASKSPAPGVPGRRSAISARADPSHRLERRGRPSSSVDLRRPSELRARRAAGSIETRWTSPVPGRREGVLAARPRPAGRSTSSRSRTLALDGRCRC